MVAHQTPEKSGHNAIEDVENEEIENEPDEGKEEFADHGSLADHGIVVFHGRAVWTLDLFEKIFEIIGIVDKIDGR